MAVDDPNTIDIMAVSGDRTTLCLVITDHFGWDNPDNTPARLNMLQDKINCYCGFSESDELLEHYPNARDMRIAIEVAFLHQPNATGIEFLNAVRDVLAEDSYSFAYRVSTA
jgi:hypothetical protein